MNEQPSYHSLYNRGVVNVAADIAISLCTPEQIQAHWPRVQELLLETPETWQGYSLPYIFERLMNGSLHMWVAGTQKEIEMFAFTQFFDLPTARILQWTWVCGKNLERYGPAFDACMTVFGDANGVTIHEVIGRPGLQKIAVARGFKPAQIILRRDADKAPSKLS